MKTTNSKDLVKVNQILPYARALWTKYESSTHKTYVFCFIFYGSKFRDKVIPAACQKLSGDNKK